VALPTLDAVVFGRVFETRRAPQSPLAGFPPRPESGPIWRIGMVHGALSIPRMTDGDDVVIDANEIAASGLDYLALGHWHSTLTARAGDVQYAYPGAPEPVAVDQDRAGNVLLVTLDLVDARRNVTVEERAVGRTRFQRLEMDASAIPSQAAFVDRLRERADPDLVLDVRVTGMRPDQLDLDVDEVETALAPAFLNVRVRDVSRASLSSGPLPSPDTIAGAFIRDLERQVKELETGADAEKAREMRDVLRLGRLLLAGEELTL
jgi:DNA repair exonuclease SbcCD nuclease subunit